MRFTKEDFPLRDGRYLRDPYIESIERKEISSLEIRADIEHGAHRERRNVAEQAMHQPAILVRSAHEYRLLDPENTRNNAKLQKAVPKEHLAAFDQMLTKLTDLKDAFIESLTLPPSEERSTRCQTLMSEMRTCMDLFPLRQTMILKWLTALPNEVAAGCFEELQTHEATMNRAFRKPAALASLIADMPAIIHNVATLSSLTGNSRITMRRRTELLQSLSGGRETAKAIATDPPPEIAPQSPTMKAVRETQRLLEEQMAHRAGFTPENPITNANDIDAEDTDASLSSHELIEVHLGAVLAIAKKCWRPGIDLHDLLQEGSLYLIEKSRGHNPSLGRLTTYLWTHLERHLQYYAASQCTVIAMSHTQNTLMRNIINLHHRLTNEGVLDEEGVRNRMRETFGESDETIQNALDWSKKLRPPISLQSYVPDTETEVSAFHEPDPAEMWDRYGKKWIWLQDTLPYPGDPEGQHLSEIQQRMLEDKIQVVLRSLTYRERELVRMSYGLSGQESMTLEEMGRVFKITRERVRQILSKAIRKLQTPVRSRHLAHFYNDLQRVQNDAPTESMPENNAEVSLEQSA